MKDPQTGEEWQEATDAAEFFLLLDSAKQYGLIEGGPTINADRCSQILDSARKRGIVPAPHAHLIERFMLLFAEAR